MGVTPLVWNLDAQEQARWRRRFAVGHIRVPSGFIITQSANGFTIDFNIRKGGYKTVFNFRFFRFGHPAEGRLFQWAKALAESLQLLVI